jgi:hypothetical protein
MNAQLAKALLSRRRFSRLVPTVRSSKSLQALQSFQRSQTLMINIANFDDQLFFLVNSSLKYSSSLRIP